MNMQINITISKDSRRLDAFLAAELNTPRTLISENIKTGNIRVNNALVKPSYQTKAGDWVTGSIHLIDEQIELVPEKTTLDIIYEDANIIVINKPAGMPVHPGAGNTRGTLVNYLLGYIPKIAEAVIDKTNEYESIRPGIIHRLDKDTSGILIVAKNARALSSVAKQIKNRKVKKIYIAICQGWPKEDKGVLHNFIGRSSKNRKLMAEVENGKGKEAISVYKVINYLKDNNNNLLSLVEFNIKTGRTHQIRIQSKIAGFPVLGDTFYGSRETKRISELLGAKRQMLHAKSIDFFLPGDDEISHFEAPLPKDMQSILASLNDAPSA